MTQILSENETIYPWHPEYRVFYEQNSIVESGNKLYRLNQDVISNEVELADVAVVVEDDTEKVIADDAEESTEDSSDLDIVEEIEDEVLPWYPSDNVFYEQYSIVSFEGEKYILTEAVVSEEVNLEDVSEPYLEEIDLNEREITSEETITSNLYEANDTSISEIKETENIDLLNVETEPITESTATELTTATNESAVITETNIEDKEVALTEDGSSVAVNLTDE